MRNLIKSIFAYCIALGGCFSLVAQTTTPPPNPTPVPEQTIPKKGDGDFVYRPRVPSHESIGFAYQNGVCYFSMPDYITYIYVTMESESGQVYTGCVYAASPAWAVSLTPGEYEISCDSDEGSHFTGTIWID